jgi:hypothetical protein
MNIEKLKQVEADFFYRFPGGFDNPEMIAIRRKHKLDRMIEMTQEAFTRRNFKLPDLIIQYLVKIISLSSLISVFEKPRFRDFAHSLSNENRQTLAQGLGEFLHGNEQHGFETMLAVLQAGKLGKWTLMTIIPAYYRPEVEVYVKPTTVKGILATSSWTTCSTGQGLPGTFIEIIVPRSTK